MARRRRQGDPTIAVGYVRVSTDDQTLGAEAQRDAIESWCSSKGLTLASLHVDTGVSGASQLADRPGLLEALAALRKSRAGICVALRRDRWARDVMIAETIRREVLRAGASMATVDHGIEGADPSSKMVSTILDATAAHERAMIRARTSAALRALQKSGRAAGGSPPYGWARTPEGELEPVAAELAAVTRALELAQLGEDTSSIARTLEAEGHPPRGQRWHRSTVWRLLRRVDRGCGPPGLHRGPIVWVP